MVLVRSYFFKKLCIQHVELEFPSWSSTLEDTFFEATNHVHGNFLIRSDNYSVVNIALHKSGQDVEIMKAKDLAFVSKNAPNSYLMVRK
jgi:hypothetical protein